MKKQSACQASIARKKRLNKSILGQQAQPTKSGLFNEVSYVSEIGD
jgi:hypothetical protein